MSNTALSKLQSYIEDSNFKGYDPYDFLNSWFPFRWFGKWGQAIAVQAGKIIPFNIRPIIGVKKEENPKGLGLMLKAYSLLYAMTKEKRCLVQANYLFERLLELRSDKKNYCWGYNFVWANPENVHPKYLASSVVTSFVAQGIYEYYVITKNEKAKEVLISSSNYILEDIVCSHIDGECCYSYTEDEAGICYNASLLAAELLAIVFAVSKEESLLPKIKSAVSYVLSKQHEDGHWNYSLNVATGQESEQVDFHQGFILNSLHHIKILIKLQDQRLDDAIAKGLKYYKECQFFPDGRSLWRVPKEFPVDIHNQAVGIITFSEFSSYSPDYKDFAIKIADWTVANMQDNSGFFYYRKFKTYTIKIPYMRWSNAWMLLALSTLNISEN